MPRIKHFLLAVALWGLGFAPALAASSNVNSLGASPAIIGSQLFYCPIGATNDYKCTATQLGAFAYSLMSGDATASGTGAVVVSGTNGNPFTSFGGRLSTASGVCVQATDTVAATTIYYAPCGGVSVPIYNGTVLIQSNFTSSATDTVGLSLALGSNWAASTLYDAFVTYNSGAVLCTGPAWTSSAAGSSSRSAALVLYDGISTNAASMVCRTSNTTTYTCPINQCTYVGTFLTNATGGQIDLKFGTIAVGGGAAVVGVCNAYNRINGRFNVMDSTSSWSTTATSTYQTLDGSLTNRVTFVSCFGGDTIAGTIGVSLNNVAANGAYATLGFNSTTAAWTNCQAGNAASAVWTNAVGNCAGAAIVGLNFLQGIQFSTSNTTTYNTNSGAPPTEGILASYWW